MRVLPSRITIRFAPANLNNSDVSEHVKEEIAARVTRSELYHLEPPLGSIVGAAFDWTLVASVADVLGIASALWTIYAEFIRPRRSESKSAGLYIVVDIDEGYEWFLGRDIDDEDEFIQVFVRALEEYGRSGRARFQLEQALHEMESSDLWARVPLQR